MVAGEGFEPSKAEPGDLQNPQGVGLGSGQIFISSGAAGLGGEDFAVPGPRWWVLDVPRGA